MTTSTSVPASSPPPKAPPRRRRWRLWLGLFAAVLIVAGGDLAAAGALIVNGALPQTTGTIHVAGPDGAITITRDHYAVPHVQAGDAHDVFFAQGYVTAQDRLWQMEFNRRVAAGRLAEILGPSVVGDDKFLRTLGLARSAQNDVNNLTPTLHAELDAYTQGVNAFLDAHRDSLPLEFRLLGFTPEPWQDTDSIAYGKVVALSLDGTWNTKLARMDVLGHGGPAAAQALFPSYPTDNPTLIDGSGTNEIPPNTSETAASSNGLTTPINKLVLTPLQQTALQSLPASIGDTTTWLRQVVLGNIASVEGSNDWVVAGAHTTTGKPLLANDPHLGINYPSIWYEVALRGGALNEIGFSFPGVPGIIIGHNDQIAWGVTNGQVDDTDLYIEKLNADGTTSLHDGQQVPVQTRQETIKVAGDKDVTITVRATIHGPIINAVADQLKGVTTPIALQWTALQPNYSFAGFFELGAAHNWQEFQAAVKDISISQNFVYADTAGNIGYRLSGWAPIRPAANGLLPVDGTTGSNDWQGQVPFDQMPHLFNPPSGIIWTANNRIVAPNYPYYISADWDAGYRARRIEQLLTAQPQLSPDDIARIQSDVVALPAQQLAPLYLAAAKLGSGAGAALAQQLLSVWDGTMSRASVAAAFYEVTTSRLIQDLVKPVLSPATFKDWNSNEYAVGKLAFLRNALTTPQPPFLAGAVARDAAIVKAENEAYAYLKQHFGSDDTSKWQWGALHQAHFDNPLVSGIAIGPAEPLRLILPNQAVTRPGDTATVNVGGDGSFTANNYDQTDLPSMRQIIDLSDLDASRFVTTTGESGQSFSAHSFDLLPLWDAGHYQPMDFTPAAVSANAGDVLTLAP